MSQIIDHIHPFIFWKIYGDERVFKCAHPDCTETRVQSFLVGKRGLCSVCGINDIIYTPDDLRRSKPRCSDCSNTKANREKRKLKDTLASMLEFSQEKKEEKEPDVQL